MAQEPKTSDKPPSIGVALGGVANSADAERTMIPVKSATEKNLLLFIIYWVFIDFLNLLITNVQNILKYANIF